MGCSVSDCNRSLPWSGFVVLSPRMNDFMSTTGRKLFAYVTMTPRPKRDVRRRGALPLKGPRGLSSSPLHGGFVKASSVVVCSQWVRLVYHDDFVLTSNTRKYEGEFHSYI